MLLSQKLHLMTLLLLLLPLLIEYMQHNSSHPGRTVSARPD